MTLTQKITLRASAIRERLNAIAGLEGDALTAEIRSESDKLGTEYRETETKLRAAIIAEDVDPTPNPGPADSDPETRERAELVRRSSIGAIFASAVEHRNTAGAEAELQGELSLNANQIPLALLRLPLETRAVTEAPGQVGQMPQPIIPYVFPASVAAFLGVETPSVPVGDQVFTVMTKKTDVRTPAEHADAAETTGTFGANVLSASRIQAAFFYSREDRARFAGMDSSLRENLSDALGDGLDRQIVIGPNGLLTGTNLANHNVSAVTSYALYRSQFGYGRVDGRYAAAVGDVKIVMGQDTYGHASGVFRSNNAGDRAALEDLQTVTAGVRVSAHVPGKTSEKQNNIIRLGNRRDMVAPIWEGVTLIEDSVTKAAAGQVVITAVMLHAVKVLREAGFYKQQAKVA